MLNDDTSHQYFVGLIIQALSPYGYQQNGDFELDYYSMFPDLLTNKGNTGSMLGTSQEIDASKEIFNSFYIDTETFSLKNTVTFKNRITGLVSFYNEIVGR